MKHLKSILLGLFFTTFCCVNAQISQDSAIAKLTSFVEKVNLFSQYMPQEKVYLHLDNSDYFLGENIWFKAYVTSSELNKPTELSKVLYVDVLSPEGNVVVSKRYHLDDGQCHGDIFLDGTTFYSGFHEIRAYTRYMTNFDPENIYSRVIPVYLSPETPGKYDDRKITGSRTNRPDRREKEEKFNDIEFTLFPQGGNLVAGIESRVAFKATDEKGRFIDVSGVVLNNQKDTLTTFSSTHQGMGEFKYIPSDEKCKVEVRSGGKKKTFNMPASLPAGYVIDVNALQNDRLTVQIQRNESLQGETLGVATMVRGKVYDFSCIDLSEGKSVVVRVDKNNLPSGVGQVLVFDVQGQVVADRMFFVRKNDVELNIIGQLDKAKYGPYEEVNIDFAVTDKNDNPIKTNFSISVRDGERSYETGVEDGLLVNMLLSSDLKGYIENPSYYFESNDRSRAYALDLLMMTQGWRRYKWVQMTGIEPIQANQIIEKCLVVDGNIRSRIKKNPKPGLDITLMMTQRAGIITGMNTISGECKTGEDGDFTFYIDELLYGKWSAAIQAKDKGKNKDNRIMLNSLFKPTPRAYTFFDTQVRKRVAKPTTLVDGVEEEAPIPQDIAENDSILIAIEAAKNASLDMKERVFDLEEVSITAKRDSRKTDEYLTAGTIEYDVMEERDRMIDEGDEEYDNVVEFLSRTDPYFNVFPSAKTIRSSQSDTDEEDPSLYADPNGYYKYKNRPVLFMLNNSPIVLQAWKSADDISMSRINKIAIYESGISPIAKYDAKGNLVSGGINLSSEVKSAEAPPTGQNMISRVRDFSYSTASGWGGISQELSDMKNDNKNPSGFDKSGKSFTNNVYIFLYSRGDYLSLLPAKGIRSTIIEGYAVTKDFYSPRYDYKPSADDVDIRRTLYWNPDVKTDDKGEAKINFFNNNSAEYFVVDAETITSDGQFGSFTW